MCVCMCACVLCMCMCICVCMCVCVCVQVMSGACASMCACVHVYVCVCMCTHVCGVYAHTCICMHRGQRLKLDVLSLSALVFSVSVSHWPWNEAGDQEIAAITLSPPPATPRLQVYGHAWLFTFILRFELMSSCLCSKCPTHSHASSPTCSF